MKGLRFLRLPLLAASIAAALAACSTKEPQPSTYFGRTISPVLTTSCVRTNTGAGCHLDRDTALLRAATEAAQSRLGHIAGSRDDLFRKTYATAADVLEPFELGAHRRYAAVPSLPFGSWSAAIAAVAGRVKALTGAAPLAVDLSRPDFDLPVVFVVAPGLRLDAPRRR